MASTASTYSNIGERNVRYVGELLNQNRHGYGVYTYPNPYFRYEGEWKNGKKHGHGKLVMADGSYYEGEFQNGEITGHGLKKWEQSGSTYTGSFVDGEMDGKGVLDYGKAGAQYQGEFSRNCRQGKGVLREADGSEYSGFFYKNRRHGTGVQDYSNGEQYDGGWVSGLRHGHGQHLYLDGSTYEGQWKTDKFSGQGKYTHCSGVSCDGVWLNGRPLNEASRLIVEGYGIEEDKLTIPQGELFSLQFLIVDDDGVPMRGEQGRKFQITAGHRNAFNVKKIFKQSSILEMIEVHERSEDQIPTPFGYSVQYYPVTEIPDDLLDAFDAMIASKDGKDEVIPVLETKSKKKSKKPDKADSRSNSNISAYSGYALSTPVDEGLQRINAYLRTFQPVHTKLSDIDANLNFCNLYLPNPHEAFGDVVHGLEEQDKEKALLNEEVVQDRSRRNSAKSPKEQLSIRGSSKKQRRSMSSSRKKLLKTGEKEEDEVVSVKLEKFINRIALRGEYVLVISEVTDPPFLGERLPNAYVSINVLPPTPSSPNQN